MPAESGMVEQIHFLKNRLSTPAMLHNNILAYFRAKVKLLLSNLRDQESGIGIPSYRGFTKSTRHSYERTESAYANEIREFNNV